MTDHRYGTPAAEVPWRLGKDPYTRSVFAVSGQGSDQDVTVAVTGSEELAGYLVRLHNMDLKRRAGHMRAVAR